MKGYDKMNNKKYHTIRTFSKSIRNMVETEIILIPLTHIYMTTHFPGFV